MFKSLSCFIAVTCIFLALMASFPLMFLVLLIITVLKLIAVAVNL